MSIVCETLTTTIQTTSIVQIAAVRDLPKAIASRIPAAVSIQKSLTALHRALLAGESGRSRKRSKSRAEIAKAWRSAWEKIEKERT